MGRDERRAQGSRHHRRDHRRSRPARPYRIHYDVAVELADAETLQPAVDRLLGSLVYPHPVSYFVPRLSRWQTRFRAEPQTPLARADTGDGAGRHSWRFSGEVESHEQIFSCTQGTPSSLRR